jgi:hypothetical protein
MASISTAMFKGSAWVPRADRASRPRSGLNTRHKVSEQAFITNFCESHRRTGRLDDKQPFEHPHEPIRITFKFHLQRTFKVTRWPAA